MMKARQTRFYGFLLAGVLPIVLATSSGQAAPVQLRFGNTIEFVHPDEVELVQYCRKAGIDYNLSSQVRNPGGGGNASTDGGRLIILYLSDNNRLTLDQLKPLEKATDLSRFNCPVWAGDDILGFFTHPGRFPKVTGLSISGAKISDEGLAGLKNLPVTELNIGSSSITDDGVLHLSKIPTLSFLRLNVSHVTDKGVSYLANLPNLSFIELKTTQITDDGLEYLGRLPKLHTLYLDDTSITGSGLRHLAPLAQFRLLSLNNTRLDDKGLAELVEHPNLRKIEALYLANTGITDAGCATFEGLNDLKVLRFDGTQVTDRGVRHLKDMPRLYNLTLSANVTEEGRNWLAENARFAPSLQSQLRSEVHSGDGDKEKTAEAELEAFRAGLTGVDSIVLRLGENTNSSEVKDVSEQLIAMRTDAIEPILDMVEECDEPGHPLNKGSTFRFNFRTNAAVVLRAVCIESMPSLADHYAESPGMRELISAALDGGGNEFIPGLEQWLRHESPRVRLEALRQLARRATIRVLGMGVAHPKHNSLKLSESGRKTAYALLADSDMNVQWAAITVVVTMDDGLSVKAKALVEVALASEHSGAANKAMTARSVLRALYLLAEQQPVGSKDLQVLIDGLVAVLRKSDNPTAGRDAMEYLGNLGGRSQPAVDLLRAIREGPDEQLAASAGRALDQIARCPITLLQATEVPVDVQNLVFTLTTDDDEAIRHATKELARRGPSMIGPLLTAARADVDEYFAQSAAAIVTRWSQEEVLPLLRPAFGWNDTGVRLLVVSSISRMKWSELPGVVKESLEDVDAKVRWNTRSVLPTLAGNTSGRASADLALLIAGELKNPGLDRTSATNLVLSLKWYYFDSSEVPSLLIDVLKQDTRYASSEACDALAEIFQKRSAEKTEDRQRIVEAIREVLQTTGDEDLRRRCIKALSQIDPRA